MIVAVVIVFFPGKTMNGVLNAEHAFIVGYGIVYRGRERVITLYDGADKQ